MAYSRRSHDFGQERRSVEQLLEPDNSFGEEVFGPHEESAHGARRDVEQGANLVPAELAVGVEVQLEGFAELVGLQLPDGFMESGPDLEPSGIG